MAFKDLSEVFDDTLSLPVGGKVYRIPSPDAALGLWCQLLMEAGQLIELGKTADEVGQIPPFPLEDGTTIDVSDGQISRDNILYERVLSRPVWAQLLADGVGWSQIQMMAQTALIWIGIGVEAAETFWNNGGNPEALAPNRRARRSSSTGGANTTKPPVSGSTTKSRRTSTARSTRKK